MLNKSLRTLICNKLQSGQYSAGRDTIFVSFCSHFGVKLKTNIDDAESALEAQEKYHKNNAAPYCWGPVFMIKCKFYQSSYWACGGREIDTLYGYFTEVVEVFAFVDAKQGYDFDTFGETVSDPDLLDTPEYLYLKERCEKKGLEYRDQFVANVGRLKRGKRTLVYLDF